MLCVWISGVFVSRMSDIAQVLQSFSALGPPGSRQLEEINERNAILELLEKAPKIAT